MEGGNLAPLIRLHAAIVDLANGRQSELFVPIDRKRAIRGRALLMPMYRDLPGERLPN